MNVKKTLFPDVGFPDTPLIVSLLLFAWAVTIFPIVNEYVFTPAPGTTHIFDSNMQARPRQFFV